MSDVKLNRGRVAMIALLLGGGLILGGVRDAQAAGNLTDSLTIADLIYTSATGNVQVDASEAAGGTIYSFQFENADGTFIPGNYNTPPGVLFLGNPTYPWGGSSEEVTAFVIGDSDAGEALGFTGIHNFGTIFPAGMDQLGLQAYLTTAVYTGSFGSSQQEFDLIVNAIPTPAALPAGAALIGLLIARRRR